MIYSLNRARRTTVGIGNRSGLVFEIGGIVRRREVGHYYFFKEKRPWENESFVLFAAFTAARATARAA